MLIGVLGLISFTYQTYTKNISMTGNVVNTRLSIIVTQSSECSFHLYKGWNLVSFYCIGMAVHRDKVLESINDSYQKIFYYDASDSSDHWKSYDKDLPDWTVQQLNYMDRVSAYWIYMNNEADYYYNGSKRSSVISLVPGWNFVGYPSKTNNTISFAMSGVMFNIMKTYDSSSSIYFVYDNSSMSNSLDTLETYKGYWVNSSAYQSWNVN